MYLFTRTARLAPGKTRESFAWAVDMTERVNRIGVIDVALWTNVFSPGLGTLTWSTVVADLATLETADAKLMTDEDYLDAIDRGASFASGDAVNDVLATIVHGELDPTSRPDYVAVVNATLAPGALRSGVAVGVEIAQRAAELTGTPTVFAMAATGGYGSVAWITGYPGVEQLERGEQAINSDASFVELIDTKASAAFLPGATQSVLRRIV
jgi:hypothetical protein